jgi:hypothetical protein
MPLKFVIQGIQVIYFLALQRLGSPQVSKLLVVVFCYKMRCAFENCELP